MGVLLALHRVGPYHQARLRCAGRSITLDVLETRPRSLEYPWEPLDPHGYGLHRLDQGLDPERDPPVASLDRQLADLLDGCKPSVIVSVGWADRSYQRLLLQAHRRRIPVVIVSDSRHRDEPRSAIKEGIKRQLLRGYSAALVAGTESRAYLVGLGFPPAAIFQPWDVVDSSFFADPPPQDPSPHPHHFLCVSRLVAKKNHPGLLDAYAAYQRQGGRWGLVLVGSGPLQQAVEARIAALPDPARVQLLPFCQAEELRCLYGRATAFVLASTTDQWGLVVNEAMASGLPCLVSSACGCAADLIEHEITGWCFDPSSPGALTELMHRVERQPPRARAAMVSAAGDRLQAFSLEAFAAGLQQAVRQAIAQPRVSRRAVLAAGLLSRLQP